MNWEGQVECGLGTLTCRPLIPDRFQDALTVFGHSNVLRRCACMYWRQPSGTPREGSEERFGKVVEAGPPGLIGYLDDEPVGWVSIAPRHEFVRLERSPVLGPVDDTPVWSINCFVTRVGYRRQGVADAMVRAAIAYARDMGAAAVEGYPWDAPTRNAPNLWVGSPRMFGGFDEVARRRPHRPIVRLDLGVGSQE